MSGKFSEIILSVFNLLAFTQSYFQLFPISPRSAGAQVQISEESGRAGGKGEEQGAGGTAGGHTNSAVLIVQARAVGGGSQARANPSGRTSRVDVACLVDGARQTKN